MDFVDLKVTINVTFAPMTIQQYNQLESFFNRMPDDSPVSNEELIKFLSLDKRPLAVTSIQRPKPDPNELVSNAEINLIC